MSVHYARRLPILAVGVLLALAIAGALLSVQAGAPSATPLPLITAEGEIGDDLGNPLQGARVTDGSRSAITGADGLYSLPTHAREVTISAPGYRKTTVKVDDAPTIVQLELMEIRALYLDPRVTDTEAEIEALVDLIDRTTVNAVVIDIKDGGVFYESDIELFQRSGSVTPLYDITTLLDRFRDHEIYTIARLVVFKDNLVAESRPDLAILDSFSGDVWRDTLGLAWVNPLQRELWTANIDLAVEAAWAGFEEIQYDYIRFPTDGDLSRADFGAELRQTVRQEAIEGFLNESRQRLLPTGAQQSADIFGFALVVDDDVGIGQNLVNLVELVDYVSPMLYPSHYSEFQFGLPGHPNDFPYEIVDISLESGIAKIGGRPLRFRPWLQDFDLSGMRSYGPEDVRAQIRATEDHGTSGWMLWDMANRYRPENLDFDVASSPVAITDRHRARR